MVAGQDGPPGLFAEVIVPIRDEGPATNQRPVMVVDPVKEGMSWLAIVQEVYATVRPHKKQYNSIH